MTRSVGARELKTRLGTYIEQVRRGVTLIVTERGESVAELARSVASGTTRRHGWKRFARAAC